jgi:cyanophycin synthetase
MKKAPQIIKEVITEMGGKIEEFVPERGCYYINIKGKRVMLERHISITRQSFVSVNLTKCKEITYKLLMAQALPTPKTECFYNRTYNKIKAIEQLKKLSYPIIIKNASGSNSQGIVPFVETVTEANTILKKELPNLRSMVAQEMVFGKEYRILVLGNKIIGALEMIHPNIVGNGKSSIRKLIKEKQTSTQKRTSFDKTLNKTLKSQKVTLDTILSKKKVIYIKRNACLAEGGETRDVTDLVHKDVADICVEASKAVGKYLVGVDVICKDISKRQTKKSFNILEINARPDMYIHHNPTHGKPRNVLRDIIKYLVKQSSPLSSHIK